MDINLFVSLLLAVVIPFVAATIKNPNSLKSAAIKKAIPALRTVANSINQLCDAVEGKVTPVSLHLHFKALKSHLKGFSL